MGKYVGLETDVFSVFGSAEWKAENISTYPDNISATGKDLEYIRVSIIPGGSGVNLNSVSGILLIDIFIEASKGPRRAAVIADNLDKYLVGKSISTILCGLVQFRSSVLSQIKPDKDDPTLSRVSYTIPFNYFGV